MGFEFKFPDVGEGLSEGKLVKWLVKPGDNVKADQAIAEVETDKAVVEVPIPEAGTVDKLLYNEGDTMTVGKPMLTLSEGGSSSEEKPQEKETGTKAEPGSQKSADEPHDEPKAAPSTAEHASNENKGSDTDPGIKAMPAVRKKAKEIGIDLSSITPSGKNGQITMNDLEGTPQKPASTPDEIPDQVQSNTNEDTLATPSTRKLARELGVDITKVQGTGDHKSITKDDVKKAANGGGETQVQKSNVQPEHLEKKPAPSSDGSEERIPMSGIRKAIAKKMVQSKNTAPHITITDEADVTELVSIRKKEKERLKEQGVKLTYLPFFIKALITSLKRFPNLNSTLDNEKEEIIVKKYFHIGIATDTEAGLMVSVVRDADHKSIIDLARDIVDLAGKAKDRKLSPQEMSGSTFTITSLGALGGQAFTPIINYPEAAILGIGRIVEKPIVRNGKIDIRKMCTFSVSCDHRIIDGAEAARFLTSFIRHIEDPDLLFMEMI